LYSQKRKFYELYLQTNVRGFAQNKRIFCTNKWVNLEDRADVSVLSVPHGSLGNVNVSLHSVTSIGGRD